MEFNREWERNECVGVMPPHCYFIPFAIDDERGLREKSSRFLSLNGEWEFKAHAELKDVRINEKLSDTIVVPSCVQMQGYDEMQYSNIRYPFPYDPPYIRKRNPVFHYRRTVKLPKAEGARLVFEGVDACFYLYVNGVRAGFSQISHRVSEFDLSGCARAGLNVVDVIVLKWCAGSYLEDQDKWRMSGIFRDAYILLRDRDGVEDYTVRSSLLPDGTARVSFTLERGVAAEVRFAGETRAVQAGGTAVFAVGAPRLWSAETPELYDMEIRAGTEIVYERVGIRSVGIDAGVLKLNGKAIKLHGVNRHDFHPAKGAAVSLEDIENDFRLMKAYNVNAVRTSHYPGCPELYRLADEYGLYVMSEADVECHGVVAVNGDYDAALYNTLAESPLYADAIRERNELNVAVNKNRPCIIMWSLGNEAGYGKNFVAAAKAVHALDDRPVHYEQHVNVAGTDAYYNDPIDVVSRMYPPIDFLKSYLNDPRETRPLVLCEYCHAMGNGPGDLGDYWRILETSDRFAGGFIWEWADHGVERKGRRYLYGSDFPNLNDGNFCIDGLFTPDRRPKPGCDEMRAVYADLRFTRTDGVYRIVNGYRFKEVSGDVRVTVKAEGEVLYAGCRSVSLRAGESAVLEVPAVEARGFTAVYFTFSGNAWAQNFFVLDERRTFTVTEFPAAVKAGKTVKAECGDYAIKVGASGALESLKYCGKEILRRPLTVNVARAPIDNDTADRRRWEKLGAFEAKMVSTVTAENGFVTACGALMAEYRRALLEYELRYTFTAEGLKLDFSYDIPPHAGDLPRAGLRFAVSDAFDKIEYLAYEGESYADKHRGTMKDVYRTDTAALYTEYIRPQENGSRYGAEYLALKGNGKLRISADKTFSFSVLPYSREQLERAAHSYELKKDGNLYVSLDDRMAGVGSGACGPQLADRYRVKGSGRIRFLIKAE